MLSAEIQSVALRSVLCWLTTVDERGQPKVSPKAIFRIVDEAQLVVANIALPTSVRNVAKNPRVCVSFIDVFVQKGFKVIGSARNVRRHSPDFAQWSPPLAALAGPRFPIHSVLVVKALEVAPIFFIAPSCRVHAAETTEEAQRASDQA